MHALHSPSYRIPGGAAAPIGRIMMRSMRLGSRSIASSLALTSSPGRKPILNKLVIGSPSLPTGSCQIASRSEAEAFESVRQFREAVEEGVGRQCVGVDAGVAVAHQHERHGSG